MFITCLLKSFLTEIDTMQDFVGHAAIMWSAGWIGGIMLGKWLRERQIQGVSDDEWNAHLEQLKADGWTFATVVINSP
jgi:hypothetical protein